MFGNIIVKNKIRKLLEFKYNKVNPPLKGGFFNTLRMLEIYLITIVITFIIILLDCYFLNRDKDLFMLHAKFFTWLCLIPVANIVISIVIIFSWIWWTLIKK